MTPARFLELDQVAVELETTADQVYRWIRTGVLPALRTANARWYVDRDDLEEFRGSSPAG